VTLVQPRLGVLSSYNGQTTRGVGVTEAGRLTRLHLYQSIESRYYGPVAVGVRCANWKIGCEALGMRGHFAVMPVAERGAGVPGPAPVYDVSWGPTIRDERPAAASARWSLARPEGVGRARTTRPPGT